MNMLILGVSILIFLVLWETWKAYYILKTKKAIVDISERIKNIIDESEQGEKSLWESVQQRNVILLKRIDSISAAQLLYTFAHAESGPEPKDPFAGKKDLIVYRHAIVSNMLAGVFWTYLPTAIICLCITIARSTLNATVFLATMGRKKRHAMKVEYVFIELFFALCRVMGRKVRHKDGIFFDLPLSSRCTQE